MKDNDIQKMLPLSQPMYLILWSLVGRKRHGYGIVKAVEKEQLGYILLTGTLYKNIDKMLRNGMIEKVEAPPNVNDDDARRVYYTATGMGEKVFDAEAQRLASWSALGGRLGYG